MWIVGNLEVFHHLILKFAPKRLHFVNNTMVARVRLAILNYNENTDRVKAFSKEGRFGRVKTKVQLCVLCLTFLKNQKAIYSSFSVFCKLVKNYLLAHFLVLELNLEAFNKSSVLMCLVFRIDKFKQVRSQKFAMWETTG